MKLISLNTWGGKYFEPLIAFIKEHSSNTDIFCFQEIYDTPMLRAYQNIRTNLLFEIKSVLSNFQILYFPTLINFDDEANPVDFNLTHGSAIFVKDSITINSKKNYFIYKDKNFQTLKKDFSNLPTPLQYIGFNLNDKKFNIFNFHGTPFPGNKLDTKRRLLEVSRVKEILSSKEGAKILVGDFNLLPQTKSIKLYEWGMKNLVKEFNIEKTRSNLSPFYGGPDFQKFADYTFVSNDVQVKSFQVPDVKISDHLPMILEFDN